MLRKVRKKNYTKKVIPTILAMTLIATSATIDLTAHGFTFFDNLFINGYNTCKNIKTQLLEAKEKYYDRPQKIAKAAAYSAAAFIGYKTIAKPLSKTIFGVRGHSRLKGITILAGCAVGAFFIYDKCFAQKRIIKQIHVAKDGIIKKLTGKISKLKQYMFERFNTTDGKISQLDQKLLNMQASIDLIKQNTSKSIEILEKHF